MALSRDGSWDDLCDEEFHLSQEEAESIAKADEVRTPSDDEGDAQAVGPNVVKNWWGKMLLQALKDEGYDWQKIWTDKTLTIVSGCTGCSAESATMKADGLKKIKQSNKQTYLRNENLCFYEPCCFLLSLVLFLGVLERFPQHFPYRLLV